MNQFDALLGLNAVLMAVALFRLRPAATMFLANQVVVLRGFSNVQSYGHPTSLSFLPSALFSQSQLDTAAIVFGVATAISIALVVLPSREPSAEHARSLPRLPPLVIWGLAIFFVFYWFSTKTIFTARYAVEGFYNFNLELAGLRTLFEGLLLYELYRRVATGELPRYAAFGLALAFAVLVHFVKGQTGSATGLLLTSAFFLIGRPEVRLRSGLMLAGTLLTVAALVVLVRGVRSQLSEDGFSSVESVVRSATEAEDVRERTGHGIESSINGTQGTAHVLMCVKLHDSGKDRGWRSIRNAVLYTVLPSFLQEPLGMERPIDATWELASHFIHGGGIHVLGDLYWNGGLLCVASMMLLIAIWIALCDSRYRASFDWLIFACMFTPPSLMGAGYGFNHLARGFFNGLIVVGVWYASRWLLVAARKTLTRIDAMTPPSLAAGEAEPEPRDDP